MTLSKGRSHRVWREIEYRFITLPSTWLWALRHGARRCPLCKLTWERPEDMESQEGRCHDCWADLMTSELVEWSHDPNGHDWDFVNSND